MKEEKQGKESVSGKRWHCTLFIDINEVPDDWQPNIDKMWGNTCVYACWSREEGEEDKTPHVHVYLHLKKTQRKAGIQKGFERDGIKHCNSIHCELARNGAEYNRNYIHHMGKYEDKKCNLIYKGEWGDIGKTGRGRRNDLTAWEKQCASLINDIDEDLHDLRDLVKRYPSHFVRSFRNIEAIRTYFKRTKQQPLLDQYDNTIKSQEETIAVAREELKKYKYILKNVPEYQKLWEQLQITIERVKTLERESLEQFKTIERLKRRINAELGHNL